MTTCKCRTTSKGPCGHGPEQWRGHASSSETVTGRSPRSRSRGTSCLTASAVGCLLSAARASEEIPSCRHDVPGHGVCERRPDDPIGRVGLPVGGSDRSQHDGAHVQAGRGLRDGPWGAEVGRAYERWPPRPGVGYPRRSPLDLGAQLPGALRGGVGVSPEVVAHLVPGRREGGHGCGSFRYGRAAKEERAPASVCLERAGDLLGPAPRPVVEGERHLGSISAPPVHDRRRACPVDGQHTRIGPHHMEARQGCRLVSALRGHVFSTGGLRLSRCVSRGMLGSRSSSDSVRSRSDSGGRRMSAGSTLARQPCHPFLTSSGS